MAAKPVRKSARKLGRKDLKKTRGGILIGLHQPMDPSKMNLSIKSSLDLKPPIGGLNDLPPASRV